MFSKGPPESYSFYFKNTKFTNRMNWIQDKEILIFQILSLVKENLIVQIGILNWYL